MLLAAAVALTPLLIFCCIYRSSDLQCFSVGRTTTINCLFPLGIGTPSHTWYLGPTWVSSPKGLTIGSAVFAQLIREPNTQTTPRCIQHLQCMQCGKIIISAQSILKKGCIVVLSLLVAENGFVQL